MPGPTASYLDLACLKPANRWRPPQPDVTVTLNSNSNTGTDIISVGAKKDIPTKGSGAKFCLDYHLPGWPN